MLGLNDPELVWKRYERFRLDLAKALTAADAGEQLEELRGVLDGALNSGVKPGTPGQPFPEDVELERKSREHAEDGPAGSRARAFWSDVADAVAADMSRQVEQDDDG